MKISKEQLKDFLRKVNVRGRVGSVVIEADGTVTVSSENELIVMGKSDIIKFSERTALKNIGLIMKVSSDVEATDINLDIEEMKLKVVAGDEKYEFRCADPATTESLSSDREKIIGIKEHLEGIKLVDTVITRIRKSITNLNSDRVSLFVENKKLYAVVIDTATESTATVEICTYKGAEFKHDFNAKILDDDVLDLVGQSGAMMYTGNKSPMFIELLGNDFLYMISYLEGGM